MESLRGGQACAVLVFPSSQNTNLLTNSRDTNERTVWLLNKRVSCPGLTGVGSGVLAGDRLVCVCY